MGREIYIQDPDGEFRKTGLVFKDGTIEGDVIPVLGMAVPDGSSCYMPKMGCFAVLAVTLCQPRMTVQRKLWVTFPSVEALDRFEVRGDRKMDKRMMTRFTSADYYLFHLRKKWDGDCKEVSNWPVEKRLLAMLHMLQSMAGEDIPFQRHSSFGLEQSEEGGAVTDITWEYEVVVFTDGSKLVLTEDGPVQAYEATDRLEHMRADGFSDRDPMLHVHDLHGKA